MESGFGLASRGSLVGRGGTSGLGLGGFVLDVVGA